VSRVGFSAAIKAMKQVGASLKLDLAQYRELAAFAMFASDLDKASQAQLNRGQRLTEILKQDQYNPLPFSRQILIIYAGTNGHLDDLPVNQIRDFEKGLYPYVEATYPQLFETIETKKALDDAIKTDMNKVLKEYKDRFVHEREAATAAAAK
jgi:F-type H+/Na+-transporting ATPase subunit alpha